MPKVDYSVIEERDFTAIEPGIYAARFSSWEYKVPRSGDLNANGDQKQPYYNCEFTADEEAGIGKRKFWKVLSIGPKSLWAFKKDMITLGADPALMQPGSEEDTDDIIASCMEAPCRLKVGKETYPKNDGTEGERNPILEVLVPELPF